MSTEAPIKIANDGLVFHIDANNPKSYVGKPTVNYVTDASTMAGWDNYSNGTPTVITTPWGTGYGYYNAGSWNGRHKSVTLPGTGTYTFSAWQKYLGGHANQTGGSCYVSSWGGGDSATYLNKTILGQWQRVSITLACTGLGPRFYMISWGGTDNSDHSSFEMTAPQVELGSYATPFVNGTRSNTQGLLDMSPNNHTITLNSLTYGASGDFYFTGNSEYMTLPVDLGYTTKISVFAWIKTIGSPRGGYHIVSGPTGLEISIPTSGEIRVGVETAAGRLVYNTWSGVTDGNWHHVGACWDVAAGYVDVYKDSACSTTTFAPTTLVPTVSGRSIGIFGVGDTSYGMNGYISTYTAYNRVLSASEILQNYNSTRSRFGL